MTALQTDVQPSAAAHRLPWRLEEIDFSKLEAERVRGDDTLFFFLVMSSFVEAASDLYTRNLSAYYAGDAEVEGWLRHHWEHEEMQHGRALRAYIRAVWPEFDWERANAGFFAEYSAMCTLDEFEPTRGLELAARCVVETGTSSLYRAIHDYTDEPLLKELTAHIKSDEVRHFSYFYRHFQRYRAVETVSRTRIVLAILKRIAEAKSEDSLVAYRHAFQVRFPETPFEDRYYRDYNRNLRRIMQRNFPFEMSVKMLLKPVGLPRRVRAPMLRLLVYGARGLIFS
ncbi:MAG TPA: ferritin-like domain-containing protein [Burkholderiales bacterium]|nr:ferritin-like domain-containing protein [Burkholderiales bacterium]